MISKVETSEALLGLKAQWKALIAYNKEQRIFQTYEWCAAAWNEYLKYDAKSLYVLVWQQKNIDDCVIFPFYLDKNGSLRFIMDEHSDYCDCVYRKGRNHHLAYKEALEQIRKDNNVRKISLHKMDGNSEALNYFSGLMSQVVVKKENSYSWINVSPSNDFAASQPQLRSKDKANVRAIRRKADKRKLRILHISHSDAFPATDFEHLIEGMKNANCRSADFMPVTLQSFCRRIYEEGLAEIVELIDEANMVVAFNFILLMKLRRLSWIFLYSDPHASTELYVKYFYENQNQGDFVFDFGTGGYDYKFGTFRPCMRVLCGLELPLTPKERTTFAFHQLMLSAKKMVKVLLKRT